MPNDPFAGISFRSPAQEEMPELMETSPTETPVMEPTAIIKETPSNPFEGISFDKAQPISSPIEQPLDVVPDGFGGETIGERLESFPERFGEAMTDVGERILHPAKQLAKQTQEDLKQMSPMEQQKQLGKEVSSLFTEVAPTMAYGLKDFLIVRPWLFASTGMINALESLGFMPETTPEMKKAWREEVSAKLSGQKRFQPTTATSALTQGVLNEAFSVPVKFVESRMDSMTSPEFQEKYPNLSDAIKWGGEFFAFGAIGKAGKRIKSIEGKTGKAQIKAENKLFADVEKALKENPEVNKTVQEFTNYQKGLMEEIQTRREQELPVGRPEQEFIIPPERVSEVPEGIPEPVRTDVSGITPEQLASIVEFQNQFIPDRRVGMGPPETALERAARLADVPGDTRLPPTRPTPLGPEPTSATGQLRTPEPTTPTRIVEFISEEGIPRSEYQINPEGKISEISKIGARKEYKISPRGKVVETEKIPGQRKVYQILTDPLRNERGSIEIPVSRKDVLERVPEAARENIRRLAKVANDQNKPFKEFLLDAGFDKKQIRQLVKMEEAIRSERPFTGQTVETQTIGKDPTKFEPGDVNVNVGPNANVKMPISQRVLNQIAQAKRTITPALQKTFEPTLHGMKKFKAPIMKDLWHKVNTIEGARLKDVKALQNGVMGLRDQFPKRKLREEAFIKIMQEDPLGLQAMEQLGIKPIEGPIKYEGLVTELKTQFKDLFDKINESRQSIGLPKLRERQNYLPMIMQENIYHSLRKIMKGEKGEVQSPNMVLDSVQAINDRLSPTSAEAVNFQYLKRKGLKEGVRLETDPLKLLNQYGTHAYKHVHYSPFNMFVNQLTTGKFKDPVTGKQTWQMKNVNPELHEFLTRWSNKLAGRPNVVHGPSMRLIEKGMSKMSQNLTAAILGYSIRTALVQPMALIPTITEFGFTPTVKGLVRTAVRSGKDPINRSQVLTNRVADVFFNDIINAKLGNRAQQVMKLPQEKAFSALRALDQIAAEATWRTAYERSRKNFDQGQAIKLADEAVVRTQGSGFVGDLSPIQMNALGKAVTLWQTYTINQMNWMARELLNIKNPERSPVETARRVFTYVAATAIVNSLFEDGMGIQSPQPAPLKEMMRSAQKGEAEFVTAYRGLLEMTELLPILSSLKFGSSPAGGVAEFMSELSNAAKEDVPKALAGDKKAMKRIGFIGGKLLGVPGTQQVKRFAQGTPLGFPIDSTKQTGKRSKRSKRKRRSRRRR